MMTTSGVSAANSREPLGDGGGLADDLEVVGALEGAAQPLTDQVVVVDQEHTRRHFVIGSQRLRSSRSSSPSHL